MELKAKYTGGHTETILCVAANNNKQFASGSENNQLCLWDQDGKIIHRTQSTNAPGGAACQTPDGDVTSLCFSASQPYNLYCAVDSCICMYDTRCMDTIVTKFDYNKEEINQLVLHPKDSFLAACDDSGQIRIIDVYQRKLYKTLRKHANICSSVTFHPKLPWHLASGGLDCSIFTWDFSRGRVFSSLDTQELNLEDTSSVPSAYTLNPPLVHSVTYSPNGLLACGLENSTVHILDFPKRSEMRVKQTLREHTQGVSQVCFHGDDLLSAGNDGKIVLWDIPIESKYDKDCKDAKEAEGEGTVCTVKGDASRTEASASNHRVTEGETEKSSDIRNIVDHGDKINWICPVQSNEQSILLVADQSDTISVYNILS